MMEASKASRPSSPPPAAEAGDGGEASRLLTAIVDSSDDAIISKNLDGIITSWNKGAERLFGYTAEEAVGRNITMLIPKDRLEEEPQIIARLKKGERVDHFETERRRKDGTTVHLSLTISPVRDGGGQIIGASKIARDITEKKHIEAQILRTNRDLEQFAFSVSHDLQEPLRSVKIYSELLERRYGDKFDGEALEFLKHMRTGAERMEMLVRDLLSYTQLMKYEKTVLAPADTDKAVQDVLATLAGAIMESGAAITVEPLPPVRVHPLHLHQLFQNLLSNAIKYHHPARPPVINVSATQQGNHRAFAVRDNGIGIAPEYKEKIFGLFKRLHSHEEYSGTGIGLAICQRIVAQYDGRIWVESEPGSGSVFRFTLPG